MKMNPDSFSTKLILNGIDKLVFTLLLMLILAVWTHYQREHERAQMRAEEVNSIEVHRPIKLVEELSHLVRQCMSFIQHRVVKGSADLTDEDQVELQSLIFDIELNLELIKSYSRATTRCVAGELQNTAGLIDDAIFKEAAKVGRLERLREKLFRDYVRLSNSMINETTAFVGGAPMDEFEEGCNLAARRIPPMRGMTWEPRRA